MEAVSGVVLAGGRSSRMGGRDKAMLMLGNRTLAENAVMRLGAQVPSLALNANGDPGRFSFPGVAVIPDADDSRAGPLAGVLAGLRWAGRLAVPPRAIVTAAVDTPFFPGDLARRLLEATARRPDLAAVAVSQGLRHPIFALWPLALADDLDAFLAKGESRKVGAFLDRHGAVAVDFAPAGPFDPFFNVNTSADLATAETLLRVRA